MAGPRCVVLGTVVQEKAELMHPLKEAAPRPGMGKGGAPDRWGSKEEEGAAGDYLRQLEIRHQGRVKDVAVGDVIREGWQRAWGQG